VYGTAHIIQLYVVSPDGTEAIVVNDGSLIPIGSTEGTLAFGPDSSADVLAGSDLSFNADGNVESAAGGTYSALFTVTVGAD
jgi:hypothetical protein